MHRHLMSALKRQSLQLQYLGIPSSIRRAQPDHLARQVISTTRRHASKRNDFDNLSIFQAQAKLHKRRIITAAGGLLASLVATALLVALYPIPKPVVRSEANPGAPPFPSQAGSVVIEDRKNPTYQSSGSSEADNDDAGRVPTGTSSVPLFPQIIHLPTSSAPTPKSSLSAGPLTSTASSRSSSSSISSSVAAAGASAIDTSATETSTEPYQLLGLGIRTVSFLSIQVYVVGLYVATADVPALQAALVHHVAGPSATTLVANERTDLRGQLLDTNAHSADAWADVLAHGNWRSALRVVPTRTTDFAHLRDGWVRGLVAAAAGRVGWSEDAAFGEAVGAFKALFGGRKSVRKGTAVVLGRGEGGRLSVWIDGGGEGAEKSQTEAKQKTATAWSSLGEVQDERISRGIWLAYLGGKKVASEEARRSIVDGMVRLGERPAGAVERVV